DSDAMEFRTLAAVAAAAERRSGPRPGFPAGIGRSVGFARTVIGPAVGWWFHMRITGRAHVPTDGPVIVAASHRSMWDIPLLGFGPALRVAAEPDALARRERAGSLTERLLREISSLLP